MAANIPSSLQVVLAPRPGNAVVPLEGIDGQKPWLLLREAAEYRVAEPQALHESSAAAILRSKRHPGVGGDRIARVLPALAVDLASIAGSKLIQQAGAQDRREVDGQVLRLLRHDQSADAGERAGRVLVNVLHSVTHHQGVLSVELPVEAEQAGIVVVDAGKISGEILGRIRVVGSCVILGQLLRNRIEPVGGNDVVREGHARARILDHFVEPAEVPSELRGGRYHSGAEKALPDAGPVVVAEEEHLVLDDGAAGGYAELVAPQRGDRLARGQKEVAGVELVVAQKFPRRAVKLVGAGLGDDIDDRAAARAELGRVLADLNTELLDRIHRRAEVPAIEEGFLVIGAVELVVVVLVRHAGCRGRALVDDRSRARALPRCPPSAWSTP